MVLFCIQNTSMNQNTSMIRMKKMWGKEVNYDMWSTWELNGKLMVGKEKGFFLLFRYLSFWCSSFISCKSPIVYMLKSYFIFYYMNFSVSLEWHFFSLILCSKITKVGFVISLNLLYFSSQLTLAFYIFFNVSNLV